MTQDHLRNLEQGDINKISGLPQSIAFGSCNSLKAFHHAFKSLSTKKKAAITTKISRLIAGRKRQTLKEPRNRWQYAWLRDGGATMYTIHRSVQCTFPFVYLVLIQRQLHVKKLLTHFRHQSLISMGEYNKPGNSSVPTPALWWCRRLRLEFDLPFT